ncbi:MAG: VWA domain-containing protein [Nautiliaceae bacterium]
MNFEYPLALTIPIIYIAFKYLFLSNEDKIIFPNAYLLNKSKIDFLEFFIILFLSFALASPVTVKIIKNHFSKGYHIVIDLDTSGSMAEFNKLLVAKELTKEFVNKRKNDSIGLVVFGNIAYIASPLTYNKKIFNTIVDKIYPTIAGEKTAIYDSLFLSANLFKNVKGEKIIILLTDGEDNISQVPLEVVLKKLQKEHIKVFTIAIGSDANFNVLQNIAQKTNGKFFIADSVQTLNNIFTTINKLTKSKIKNETYIQKHYFYEYPLMITLVLLWLYILRYRKSLWSY